MLKREAILLDIDVTNAEEAIREGGKLLEKTGLTTSDYTEALVEAFIDLGAYIVIAPLVAIPHAKPGKYVMETSMSFIRLKSPVNFGHPTNDPVKIVMCLASAENDGHMELIRNLAIALNDPANIEMMLSTGSVSEILEIFDRKEN